MNRRTILASSFALLAAPKPTFAQTPSASPVSAEPQDDPVDTTARDLTQLLQQVPPADLLAALETAPITTQILVEAAGDAELQPRPWADYGDSDLHHSLGGVALTLDDRSLHDVDGESLGAYIVFESAEIAYAEFVRRMEAMPTSMSTVAAGVNVWILEYDDEELGISRIGNVVHMGLLSHHPDTMTGMIEHLAEVAASA